MFLVLTNIYYSIYIILDMYIKLYDTLKLYKSGLFCYG